MLTNIKFHISNSVFLLWKGQGGGKKTPSSKNIKLIYISLFIFLCYKPTFSQSPAGLTLPQAIQLAQENSLLVKQAENKLLSAYWRYRSFEAQLKPYIDLTAQPIRFDRAVVERYDSDLNRDVYRTQQTFSSSVRLGLNQRIGLTGGLVFLDTDFNRLQTLGSSDVTNYFSTPFRIGLSQELGGFNEFKWNKQIEPLLNQKAKQDFVLALENIAFQSTELFFSLAQTRLNAELAQFNLAQTDTLLSLGRERLQLGTVTQDEILELEMRYISEQTALATAQLNEQKAAYELSLILGIDIEALESISLPDSIPNLTIDPEQAVELAAQNHPDWLGYEQKRLQAQREVEKTLRENRFQASLNASFGLNQQSNELMNAYNFPMEQQQRVSLSLNIPILDWGQRKGQLEQVRFQQEVIAAENAQAEQEFIQNVRIQALEFALQPQLVAQALQRESLAIRRYDITRQRYVLGSVDLLNLNSSLDARNQARQAVLQAKQQYWALYYTLRSLTLYDFEKGMKLGSRNP